MNTKGIITALVTIAIGVILTTGVLVPVIENASSSGGNGNTDEQIVNDLSDVLATADIIIPEKYNSHQIYSSVGTFPEQVTSNYIMDLNDFIGVYNTPVQISPDADYDFQLILVNGISDDTLNDLTVKYNYSSGTYLEIYGDNSSVWNDITKWTNFELNFNTGHIHMETVVEEQTYTVDAMVDFAFAISELDDGYVYCMNDGTYMEIPSLQIDGVRDFCVHISTGVSGSDSFADAWIMKSANTEFTASYLNISGCTMIYLDQPICTADVSVPLNDGKTPCINPNCTVSNVIATGNNITEPYVCLVEFTSTMLEVSGSGGSGSSTSVSPTISAMLSVIPLIVIVGLIVGTVGYFLRKQ